MEYNYEYTYTNTQWQIQIQSYKYRYKYTNEQIQERGNERKSDPHWLMEAPPLGNDKDSLAIFFIYFQVFFLFVCFLRIFPFFKLALMESPPQGIVKDSFASFCFSYNLVLKNISALLFCKLCQELFTQWFCSQPAILLFSLKPAPVPQCSHLNYEGNSWQMTKQTNATLNHFKAFSLFSQNMFF